jgi:hypothetical protein
MISFIDEDRKPRNDALGCILIPPMSLSWPHFCGPLGMNNSPLSWKNRSELFQIPVNIHIYHMTV